MANQAQMTAAIIVVAIVIIAIAVGASRTREHFSSKTGTGPAVPAEPLYLSGGNPTCSPNKLSVQGLMGIWNSGSNRPLVMKSLWDAWANNSPNTVNVNYPCDPSLSPPGPLVPMMINGTGPNSLHGLCNSGAGPVCNLAQQWSNLNGGVDPSTLTTPTPLNVIGGPANNSLAGICAADKTSHAACDLYNAVVSLQQQQQ